MREKERREEKKETLRDRESVSQSKPWLGRKE